MNLHIIIKSISNYCLFNVNNIIIYNMQEDNINVSCYLHYLCKISS